MQGKMWIAYYGLWYRTSHCQKKKSNEQVLQDQRYIFLRISNLGVFKFHKILQLICPGALVL